MSAAGLSPADPSLLRTPLEFIREDHRRERRICAMIDRLAGGAALDRPLAVTVLRFLNEELIVHMRDEVEDLFPLLEKRCVPEDSIGGTIGRITTTQQDAMRLLPRVRAALVRCVDTGDALSARETRLLARFADHVRRLLVAEHAILLPIARARLTARDLQGLSLGMRTRRGLPPFRETHDA
jgi:iron-sulfur cluster repair protein YtfE (RIC family)